MRRVHNGTHPPPARPSIPGQTLHYRVVFPTVAEAAELAAWGNLELAGEPVLVVLATGACPPPPAVVWFWCHCCFVVVCQFPAGVNRSHGGWPGSRPPLFIHLLSGSGNNFETRRNGQKCLFAGRQAPPPAFPKQHGNACSEWCICSLCPPIRAFQFCRFYLGLGLPALGVRLWWTTVFGDGVALCLAPVQPRVSIGGGTGGLLASTKAKFLQRRRC